MWVLGIEPRSSAEQSVLLTAEPSLQPPFSFVLFCFVKDFWQGLLSAIQLKVNHNRRKELNQGLRISSKHQDQNPISIVSKNFPINFKKNGGRGLNSCALQVINETRVNKHAKCFTFSCRHSSYIESYKKSISFNMHPVFNAM